MQTAGELAAEMSRRSGLDRLRSVLLTQFEQRSRILKARSALAVLVDVLRTDDGPRAAELRAAVEELTASTHEFEEVRLLDAVRSGMVELAPDKLAELDQLLGGSGHDPASRLGLELEAATPSELRTAALTALSRWQRVAEHPLSSRPAQLAARTATRTLEGPARGDGLTSPLRLAPMSQVPIYIKLHQIATFIPAALKQIWVKLRPVDRTPARIGCARPSRSEFVPRFWTRWRS